MQQIPLDAVPVIDNSRAAARKAAMEAAAARAVIGIDRAANKADAERPGWWFVYDVYRHRSSDGRF